MLVRPTIVVLSVATLSLPEHLSSPLVLVGFVFPCSLVLCVMFCRSLFVLLSFLAIMLSVLRRFTASDYPFGIFDLRLLITPWYLRFTASDYPLVS